MIIPKIEDSRYFADNIMKRPFLPLIHVMSGVVEPYPNLKSIPFSAPMKNIFHREKLVDPKVPPTLQDEKIGLKMARWTPDEWQ